MRWDISYKVHMNKLISIAMVRRTQLYLKSKRSEVEDIRLCY